MNLIWTFNPFQENERLNLLGKELIKNLFMKDSIEAVYVASNSEVELATAFNAPKESRYSTYPKNLIQKQLNKISASKKIKIKILQSLKLSLTSSVDEIVQYSKREEVDLILMATNTKKSLPALVFGSFAETLAHLSVCNLMIYHQKTKFNNTLPRKILYAHDFTPKGVTGLLQISQYAKKWDATLIVIHIPTPIPDISDEEYEMSVDKQSYKNEQLLIRNSVKYEIMNIYDDAPTYETILRVSQKEKVDLMALTAQSSKLKILMGGSVTRKILRKAKIPMMVMKVK